MFHYLQGRQARLCGKANANIINIAHLCWVHWKERWGGCSHTPGDTHSSATSPSPLLDDRGCEARSGTSGCRLPRRLPRVKLTGTRPEKFLVSPLAVLVTVTSGQQEERAKVLGRGGYERLIKGPVLEVTLSPCLRVPTQARPSRPVPESQEEPAMRARAEPTPPPEPRPPPGDSRPSSCQPRPPVCAPAQRFLGARNPGRAGGARARERARRRQPHSAPGHLPCHQLRQPLGPASRAWWLRAVGVCPPPGRARCPRASPLERTGESPLRRAGPLQNRFAAALGDGSPGPLKVKAASATSAAAQILQEPPRLC